MPKFSEKGSVLLILLIILLLVGGVTGFLVYKTLTISTQKVSKNVEVMTVALKSEYENPFDKNTQYDNPFNEYHNPFDALK